MPIPEFTPEEKYLIAYVKSPETFRTNIFMYAFLAVGTAWLGFGIAYESIPMLLAGYGTLLVGRIYEETFGSKYHPFWKSLVEKFETACTDVPQHSSESSQS